MFAKLIQIQHVVKCLETETLKQRHMKQLSDLSVSVTVDFCVVDRSSNKPVNEMIKFMSGFINDLEKDIKIK